MVLGTTSGAGKSWLATALCRWYARQGLKVAPFKAQNMSNNARVVAGGEIGSAQYFQALAARAVPDVRMNPLLLKPERDTAQPGGAARAGERRTLAHALARPQRAASGRAIAQALDALRAENDVVVIEGAGSPAEINLTASDIVNLRVAQHADARCLLVTDIDRGGAFAHLYGTWALLAEAERTLIRGFVLNKFRGDASLLAPGPQQLQQLTGVPDRRDAADVVAARPARRRRRVRRSQHGRAARCTSTIAVIAYPRISNLDEFQPLKNMPGVRLRWARSPADAGAAPTGSSCPAPSTPAATWPGCARRAWTARWPQHAERGGAVLGICGGLQMLGEALIDPHGIDGNAPGLGLLPLVTAVRAGQDGAADAGALRRGGGRLGGAVGRDDATATRSTMARPRSIPPWPPRARA